MALPERIRSISAAAISSAPTASTVPPIRAWPCSASNGASVANRQCAVSKKAWPQRVAAIHEQAFDEQTNPRVQQPRDLSGAFGQRTFGAVEGAQRAIEIMLGVVQPRNIT